jgi:hypothetical protein
MSRSALASALAVAAAAAAFAACNDDKPKHPTAPESPAASVSDAPALDAAGGVSTVCLAYRNKLSVAQEKLADATKGKAGMVTRVALAKKAEKLDAMTKDACR